MSIAQHLINNWSGLLTDYFNTKSKIKWQERFTKTADKINHDEPWLTLVAVFSLFGKKLDWNQTKRLDAFNMLLKTCGLDNVPQIESITKIQFEKWIKEIPSYRNELKRSAFHHYPNIIKEIDIRKQKRMVRLEGPTHMDLFIQGKSGERTIGFFIEAKYNSDISFDIKYNPARDQIARNIDAAIEYQSEKVKDKNIDDFYFLLLTPKIFRTDKFGGNRKTSIEMFHPNKSRLYCYKMDEYKDFRNLRLALPHRVEISENKWKHISGNIGWLTFEDMIKTAQHYGTIDVGAKIMLENFMNERNMIAK